MFKRLAHTLKLNLEHPPSNQIESVLEELEEGISKVNNQFEKIIQQESQMIAKLQQYVQQHETKKLAAKKAFNEGKKLSAESLYQESNLLKQQIGQYQKLIKEIEATKQRLLSQKGEFEFTRDQLIAKLTLGEANAGTSHIHAELSEHLMLLQESDELGKYDNMIREAESKSQAIKEMQDLDHELDSFISESPNAGALTELEAELRQERELKLKENFQQKRELFHQIFGDTNTQQDQVERDRAHKSDLIHQLKASSGEKVKQSKLDDFFSEEKTPERPSEHEDRIRNFFNNK